MDWCEIYTAEKKPAASEITVFINNPLYSGFCQYIEETYGVLPLIEYSGCCMAGFSGFNAKYKKSGKSLCTFCNNLYL